MMFAVQEGRDMISRCSVNISKRDWLIVWGKRKDKHKLIVDWEESKHIKHGDKINALTAAKVGRDITAWINGHDVASVGDDWITSGYVGIFVSTLPTESVAHVRFKDVEVHGIE